MWKNFSFILLAFLTLCFGGFCEQTQFDLRDVDLKSNIVSLQGKWQFEFGQLLTAKEMQNLDSPTYVNAPHSWTGIEFHGKEIPSTGYATYYAKVWVNKNQKHLAINGKVMTTNYKLWVNGKELGEVGKLAKTAENAEPDYLNKVFLLPEHKGELDIVFQISNYHYRKGGMTRAPQIADSNLLKESRGKNMALSFFLIGSIFFMGLYHAGLNLFQIRNKMNTYFALVCFFTILRTLSVNEYLLIEYLHFPWWLSTKIELISFYLILGFTVRFIYHLFPHHIPTFLAKIPYYIAINATIITIFTPILYNSHLVPILQTVTVLTSCGLLYFLAKASIKGDNEVKIALVGFLLLFVVTVLEILIHHSQIIGELVFALGIFLYLFSHVVILAKRQNYTFLKNKGLSIAFQKSNELLEKTVEERTKELNQRNTELLENNQELKKLHDEKNGLIHVLAHDLKSPLSHNTGIIQLIRMENNLSGEQKDYLQKLEKSNKQGVHLIEDLLQLYKIESKQTLEIESINPNSYFEDIFKKHEDTAGLKNIKIIKDIKCNDRGFNTDPDYLQRIMDNLVSNALKFSYENSTVEATVIHKGSTLEIEVKDYGTGILPQEQERVFQKFQKMSNKPTAGESSSGLGLSIVKTLVEELNGSVDFESAPGKGTTFGVVLNDLKSAIK